MGSTIHKKVHEGECEASLGRACRHEEEEATLDKKRRRTEIPIQGVKVRIIDGIKGYYQLLDIVQ